MISALSPGAISAGVSEFECNRLEPHMLDRLRDTAVSRHKNPCRFVEPLQRPGMQVIAMPVRHINKVHIDIF